MENKLKNKLIDLFWEIIVNLIDLFQEIKERIVDQKPHASIRAIMKEINSNLRGPFFWAILREDEMLADFSKSQCGIINFLTLVKKGQYRLERKMVGWGSNNPEAPWLVLENTTVGAREAWWLERTTKGEISLKLDADL